MEIHMGMSTHTNTHTGTSTHIKWYGTLYIHCTRHTQQHTHSHTKPLLLGGLHNVHHKTWLCNDRALHMLATQTHTQHICTTDDDMLMMLETITMRAMMMRASASAIKITIKHAHSNTHKTAARHLFHAHTQSPLECNICWAITGHHRALCPCIFILLYTTHSCVPRV